jgi:hypothetical protein
LLAQELMDAEVTEAIGAAPYERTDKRMTSRNGVREREWDTRVGTIELAIPKLRQGSYFPSLLEPRRRHERALLAVVQEAYVHGVSTRNVDALAQALGLNVVGVLGGDQLRPWHFVGIGVGLFAIALINGVSRETLAGARRGVALAVVAGLSFGLFFIVFHAASSTGVTAFLFGRAGSALAALCFRTDRRCSLCRQAQRLGSYRHRRRARWNWNRAVSLRVPRWLAFTDCAAHFLLSGVHDVGCAPLHTRAADRDTGGGCGSGRGCGGLDRRRLTRRASTTLLQLSKVWS